MVRLIGIDADGTLLDSEGGIPAANLEAVALAVQAGVHVAVVTGRSYPSIRPLVSALPASVTLLVSNGAVERSMDGATRARRLLNRHVARTVLGSTRAHRNAAALIFDRDDGRQILFESMDWAHPARRGYWARNRSLIDRAAPLEDALVEDPIQVMFNGAVVDMRVLAGQLRSAMRGFAVSLTEYPDRDFSLVDVTAPEATKGNALAALAGSLGIDRAEVMAIGDNFNDLDMLEFAGVPVVMTNAAPELRRDDWHLAPTNSEAGVADAIRRLVLATPAP